MKLECISSLNKAAWVMFQYFHMSYFVILGDVLEHHTQMRSRKDMTYSGITHKSDPETFYKKTLRFPNKLSLYFPFIKQHCKRNEDKGNLRLRLPYCINTFHTGCDSCPRVLLCFVNIYQVLQHPHNMGIHSW